MDITAAEAIGERATRSKTGGFDSRGGSQSEKRAACAGIQYGKRRTRLNNCDAADSPVCQECTLQTGFVFEERQIVAVADGQTMSAVEIGQRARCVQRGLVVECAVERSVAGRSCVSRARESVGRLEITGAPTARYGGLQRVVVRVGVVGEQLETVVAIDALSPRARDRITESVGSDLVAIHHDRVGGGRILRLQRIASFTQVRSFGADVSDFENPLATESALNGQVPLLSVRYNEVAWHGETENSQGLQRTRAGSACGGSVVSRLSCVATGKVLEDVQTRHKGWIQSTGQR